MHALPCIRTCIWFATVPEQGLSRGTLPCAQVVLPASVAVAELQAALVEPSGIMARKQKLIFKGKVRRITAVSHRQIQQLAVCVRFGK